MSPAKNPTPRNQGATEGGILPPEAEQRLSQDASAVADKAKAEFADVKAGAEADIGALAEEGKRQLDQTIEKAKGLAAEQKNLFAEQLTGISSAVGKVADELELEGASTAGYARTIADGVDRVTRTIKERDVDSLVALAEDFGRKQPAAFMAAAAIAGFAASRFLVASAKRRESQTPQRSTYQAAGEADYAASAAPLSDELSTRDTMGGTI